MGPVLLRNRKVLIAVLFLLPLVAGLAWWKREPLQAWYYLRCLSTAEETGRGIWVERVAGLDCAAVPGLLGCLNGGEARACANAAPALIALAERWTPDDPRRSELAGRLAEAYPRLPPCGQQAALQVFSAWLSQGQAPEGVIHAGSRLPAQAGHSPDGGVRGRGLELAAALLERPNNGELIADCRELAKACLTDQEPANRMRAVQAAGHPGMGLLDQVVPLLNDPAAEVRREALRALGTESSVVSTDHLLPLLHDPDGDVRLLCETVLRSRGFEGKHLKLARLITDARPAVRLQVLEYFVVETDLEPGVWLHRLSMDPAPEVRGGAMIVACDYHPEIDFGDRLRELASSDPNSLVRANARYFLGRQQRRMGMPIP